jgi:8-oxo-dGTP pyrophosphatase MutT (NUDIX family)
LPKVRVMTVLSPPDLAKTLSEAERERRWPNQRPRAAATLIIMDRSHGGPRLLMGKRNRLAKFMPNKFVFPGGRIELADRYLSVADSLHPLVEAKLMARVRRPTRGRARALALAAIRETFEETGILIGSRPVPVASPRATGVWRQFIAQGVLPSLAGIHLIARAITPPRRPKRFDASFLAIDAVHIAGQVDGIVGPDAEFVETVWIGLAEAYKLDLPIITSVVLQELTTRLARGMAHDLPVPFYYEKNRRWMREEL